MDFTEFGDIELKQIPEGGVQIEWKIAEFSLIDQTGNYISPKFSYKSGSWNLSLWHLDSQQYPDFIYLSLKSEKIRSYAVQYNLGIQKVNGVKKIENGVLEEEKSLSFPTNVLHLSKILQCDSEFLLSDVLTVVCHLKRVSKRSTKPNVQVDRSPQNPTTPNVFGKPQPKKLSKLDILSENFKSIFASKESCDTTLNVKGTEYKAHRVVLMARSSVFEAMFLHETSEKQTGIVTIPDCDPESFEEFLEYLYCGQLEELSPRKTIHLYEIADKYDAQELKEFCLECLSDNLTVENVCDVIIMADKYDETELFSAAQCFFNRNFKEILLTSEWECLLKNNYRLGNRIFIEMSSKMKIEN